MLFVSNDYISLSENTIKFYLTLFTGSILFYFIF